MRNVYVGSCIALALLVGVLASLVAYVRSAPLSDQVAGVTFTSKSSEYEVFLHSQGTLVAPFVTLQNHTSVTKTMQIVASCSCNELSPQSVTLRPKQSVRVQYKVQAPPTWSGEKFVHIRAIDDGNAALATISIRWAFRPPLKCVPASLNFAQSRNSVVADHSEVSLQVDDGLDVNDFEWKAVPEGFVELDAVIDGLRTARLRVTPLSHSENSPMRLNGSIQIAHKHSDYVYVVPVTSVVPTAVALSPSTLRLSSNKDSTGQVFVFAMKDVALGELVRVEPEGVLTVSDAGRFSDRIRKLEVRWSPDASFEARRSKHALRLLFSANDRDLVLSVVPR